MKIGITGATGHLGRLVVEKLKSKIPSEDIVALVRSVDKAGDMGISARAFGYEKPETLADELTGIDTLFFISANRLNDRVSLHKNVVNAVKNSKIKWIVYTSLLHADTTSLGLGEDHRQTEQLIKETGIPFTFLRNGWYTENYAGSIDGAINGGAFIGCAGNGKVSGAAREDYADAAVAVLTGTGHESKTYELAGDGYFTLADFAKEISNSAGKNIPYMNLDEKDYAEALMKMGLPKDVANAIAGWDTGAAKNDLFDDSHTLSRLTGKPTRPFGVTVKEFVEKVEVTK